MKITTSFRGRFSATCLSHNSGWWRLWSNDEHTGNFRSIHRQTRSRNILPPIIPSTLLWNCTRGSVVSSQCQATATS